MRRRIHPAIDVDVDLVPLIDCVFLLLLFFILCGRLIDEERWEQVTVPPATTAHEVVKRQDWQRTTINVKGDALHPEVVMGGARLTGNTGEVWSQVRTRLDRIHDQAERRSDARAPMGFAPKVVISLRADLDMDWRVVQDCQQILADSIDPRTGTPKEGLRRPFTQLEFAAWKP